MSLTQVGYDEQNGNDPNVVVQTLDIKIQNGCQLKSSCLVHGLFHQGVDIGIDSRNLTQRLFLKRIVIIFRGGQKSSSIRGLISSNTRLPPHDLPIIRLSLITSEQIKIEK